MIQSISYFNKRIVLFLLLFIPVSLISGLLYNYLITSRIYNKEAAQLPQSTETIFMGDSHAMCAFNDSIIPNSFNASRNSESYFQTFNKLNWILNSNPQIRTVVMSYSPHNISIGQNEIILYGDRYFPILDKRSKEIILKAKTLGLISYNHNRYINWLYDLKHLLMFYFLELKWNWGIPVNMNENWKYITEPKKSDAKMYLHPLFTTRYTSDHSNLNDRNTQATLNGHFYTGGNSDWSDIMVSYLIKIGELCASNKATLLLVSTPLHNSYKRAIPQDILSRYYLLADSLTTLYNFIVFADYSDLEFQDKLYGDGDHLNYSGNKIFSESFSKNLDQLKLSGY